MQEGRGNGGQSVSRNQDHNQAWGQDNVTPADPGLSLSRSAVYTMIILAHLFGLASILAWMVFMFSGSFNLVDMGLSEGGRLGVNACLCLLFFLQHSFMIRGFFRQWLASFVREDYHGALYAITSGISLFILVVFWQGSDRVLADPHGIVRWLMRAGFLLSLLGFAWGIRALKSFDMLGMGPLLHNLRGTNPPALVPFTVRGPYRWVRHPLYLSCLLMIWSGPEVTADRLLHNLLCTVWMVMASMLEERDLVACFGKVYREYQSQVPMLIPRRIKPAWQE